MKIMLELRKLLEIKRRPEHRLTLQDIYILYPNNEKVDWGTFRDVCKTFNHLLVKSAIETGNIYKLPLRLGTISARKRKASKGKKIDMLHFFKTGERIYHKNRHSEGYYAQLFWDKSSPQCIVTNTGLIKYVPTRYHKRYLSSAIRDRNLIVKYFEYN